MDTEGVLLSRRNASIAQVTEFSKGAQRLRLSLLPKLSAETEAEIPSLHLIVFYVPFQKLFQSPRLDARNLRYIGWQATDMKGGVVNFLFYGECCSIMSRAVPGNLWAAKNPKLLPLMANGGDNASKYGTDERRSFIVTSENDMLLIGRLSEYRQCIATDSYGRVCGIPVRQDGERRKTSSRVVPALCSTHDGSSRVQESLDGKEAAPQATSAATDGAKSEKIAVTGTPNENLDTSNENSAGHTEVAVGAAGGAAGVVKKTSALDARLKRHTGRLTTAGGNSAAAAEAVVAVTADDIRLDLEGVASSIAGILTKLKMLENVDDKELAESDLVVLLEKLKKIEVPPDAVEAQYALALFKPHFDEVKRITTNEKAGAAVFVTQRKWTRAAKSPALAVF